MRSQGLTTASEVYISQNGMQAMDVNISPVVDIDWKVFNPWRIQPLRHRMCGHPLLQAEQLVELGKRCRGTTRWFAFNNGARADADFGHADSLFPCGQSYVDSLRSISDAKAWVLLRHIQEDPLYRPLVDLALDSIKPHTETRDPGMYYRAGWIFAASPDTVTPFHIDRDHVVLLQIRGSKRIHVWDAHDPEVVGDRARDCFHTRHTLDLVQWHEEHRARAHVFDLQPGQGVYMPQTSPHMVETSADSSVTISFSYGTRATRHSAMLHVMREQLHRTGMHPPAVGRSRVFDRAACALGSAMVAMRGPGSRPPACPSLRRRYTYAVAD